MNKLEAIEIIERNKIKASRVVETDSGEEVIQNKIKLVDYVPLDIVVNTIDKIGLKRVVVQQGMGCFMPWVTVSAIKILLNG